MNKMSVDHLKPLLRPKGEVISYPLCRVVPGLGTTSLDWRSLLKGRCRQHCFIVIFAGGNDPQDVQLTEYKFSKVSFLKWWKLEVLLSHYDAVLLRENVNCIAMLVTAKLLTHETQLQISPRVGVIHPKVKGCLLHFMRGFQSGTNKCRRWWQKLRTSIGAALNDSLLAKRIIVDSQSRLQANALDCENSPLFLLQAKAQIALIVSVFRYCSALRLPWRCKKAHTRVE